jgi:hypothetical protein
MIRSQLTPRFSISLSARAKKKKRSAGDISAHDQQGTLFLVGTIFKPPSFSGFLESFLKNSDAPPDDCCRNHLAEVILQ